MTILRKCKCGTLATNEDELELFEKDSKSRYGRKNVCKECAALRTRGGQPLAPKGKTCAKCHTKYFGLLEIAENFKRATPRNGEAVGNLSRVCETCRNTEGDYVYIDGVAVPKNIKERLANGKL